MAAAVRRLRRQRRQRHMLPRPRVFLDRSNPLENLDEEEVFARYRFCPASIIFIVNSVRDILERETKRNHSISALLQVLLFLRFMASGAHLKLVGDSLHIAESSAGRIVKSVTNAIIERFRHIITFPTGEMAVRVMEGFRRIAGFPRVIGCIDGTQIRISTPHQNEADFVNRKGFHSLNIQMVCDPDFRITSLCARWPGSCHDSRIWRTSSLCHQFENGVHDGLLLADSGYPLTRHMMTPYLTPQTPNEERFNASLCRTRVLIEQTFGILKRKFQALHFGLRTTPEQAILYITACVILHNLGLERGDISLQQYCTDIDPAACLQVNVQEPAVHARNDGVLKRAAITQGFFKGIPSLIKGVIAFGINIIKCYIGENKLYSSVIFSLLSMKSLILPIV